MKVHAVVASCSIMDYGNRGTHAQREEWSWKAMVTCWAMRGDIYQLGDSRTCGTLLHENFPIRRLYQG